MPRIFLTTYKISNEHGAACGEWIDDFSDLEADLARIGATYGDPTAEEPMIADHEGWDGVDPRDYYIAQLGELAELIEERGDDVAALVACVGRGYYTDVDALRRAVESATFVWGRDAKDAAETYCYDYGVLDDVPEHLRCYFDCESWVNDATSGDLAAFDCNGRHVIVAKGRRSPGRSSRSGGIP